MSAEEFDSWLPAVPDDAPARELQLQRRKHQIIVLEKFAETGDIEKSCYAAGLSRWTHFTWMRHHRAYRIAYARIREHLGDRLEASVYNRALNGVEKPIVREGEVVGTYQEFDTGREALMLRGFKASVYAQKLEVQMRYASDGELYDKIREILSKAGVEWDGDPAKLEFDGDAAGESGPGSGSGGNKET